MTTGADAFRQLDQLARKLMADQDADIILYSGPISASPASRLVGMCRTRAAKRKNVCLFIMTTGGSADAAYRIARCLKRSYGKFTVYVSDNCKSAGTLVVVGADELVISDFGELGPLDVQLSKPDELGEVSSGLTPMQALNTLQVQTFSLFEHHFLRIRSHSGLQITTRTAAELASSMAVGMFAPIYAQIDPMRLGEMTLAMRIAQEYGERIGSTNLKEEALESLVAAYPSHEFVIDRDEAETLFKHVREPTQEEDQLLGLTHHLMHILDDEDIVVSYLEDMLTDPSEDEEREAEDEGPNPNPDRTDHDEEQPEIDETD